MKKTLSLLFLISFSLFGQEYFYSNSLAMELYPINNSSSLNFSEEEWILEKVKQGNNIISTLYNFGRIEKSYTYKYRSNGSLEFFSESVSGIIQEETYYRSDGQISEIRLYNNDGSLKNIQTYKYNDNNVLKNIELKDSSGILHSKLDYEIREDGSIRSVQESEGETLNHLETWNSYGGSLFMEQRLNDSFRDIVYYNQNNFIDRALKYDGNELIYEEIYSYYPDSTIKQIERNNFISNEYILETMNVSGQIIQEDLYRNDILIYSSNYVYSGEKLIIKEKAGSGTREKWIFAYRDEDLISEEYYKQGLLEQKKKNIDSESNSYIIELYNQGKAFMNLIYEDDVKVKEEFLSDGRVIRTREIGDL